MSTDPTPGEVGLSDREDAALAEWWVSEGGDYEDIAIERLTDVVERILAARTADLRAEVGEFGDRCARCRVSVGQIVADLRAEHAAEVEKAREDGYWTGYREGKDEAETRDLDYDEMTDRAEAAEAREVELRATVDRVEALRPTGEREWSNQGRTGTAQTVDCSDLRAALTTPPTTEGA